MDEHNCTLAAQCADWLLYIGYFLSLSNRKKHSIRLKYISFHTFLFHYLLTCFWINALLITAFITSSQTIFWYHTYLSTTDYADYYPTQDNIVTWNTNHSIYNVWMQNFHCITPIYSIWQRDKISKWETEYTKNIFWQCSALRDM